jgi:hypothetical protein
MRAADVDVQPLEEADHTFSDLRHKLRLQEITLRWAGSISANRRALP